MLKNWYAICDNDWIFNKKIKSELSLLLYISSLTAEKGFCFASNSHFSDRLKIHENTISRKIKKLEKLWLIHIEYKYRGSEITKREIRLTKTLTDHIQKCTPTINKNVRDNNTSINNNSKELQKVEIIKSSENEIVEYWNVEINALIQLLYKAVWIDDFKESKLWQRRYAKHMVDLIKKNWKQDFISRLKWVLEDGFKQKNCNSIKFLYWEIKSFMHSPVVEVNWNQQMIRKAFEPLTNKQKVKVREIIKTWKYSNPHKELSEWVLNNMIDSIM